MTALFKYFVGIAAILAAVMILSAVSMSEIFVRLAAVAHSPAIETPRWNIEHPKAEPDTRNIVHGSLIPSRVTRNPPAALGRVCHNRPCV
jgi:hypothetical protein